MSGNRNLSPGPTRPPIERAVPSDDRTTVTTSPESDGGFDDPTAARLRDANARLDAVRAAVIIARRDAQYHVEHESDPAEYRTARGWKVLTDLLDEIDAASYGGSAPTEPTAADDQGW